MTWYDLLFAHWPLPPKSLESLIPRRLKLDTYAGEAWLGIVPFEMRNVRPRCVPPIPGVSSFLELNVRTYVTLGGKPGVWFFSLDAESRLAVRGARLYFHLPYFDARMSSTRNLGSIQYMSERTHKGARPASWQASYHPTGPPFIAPAGSLEDWLTSRYCLYSASPRGKVFRGEIDHDPWPLQNAEADIQRNSMTAQIAVALPGSKPLLHFAQELNIVGWLPEHAE